METKAFIEKLTESAQGFEFRFTNELVTYNHSSKKISVNWHKAREWEFYPLLLYRAMEGFNKTSKARGIKITLQYIEIIDYGAFQNKIIDYPIQDYGSTEYLTSQEQALEVVLMVVLG